MLAICTPVFRQVEPDFLVSLHETLKAGGRGVSWIFVQGHANLSRARNYLVREARDRNAEAIVFIDSDIGWDVNAFGALFETPDDVRVVAGCPQRRDDRLGFCGIPDTPVMQRKGRLVSGHAATAFLRVDMSVFDELDSKTEHYEYQGKDYTGFFQTKITGGEMLDEDVYFSRLCRANGIDVWLDPAIRLRHWHSQPLTGLMADHIRFTPLKEAVNG